MENRLKIFKNDELGEIRTKEINNNPHVCLADVCKILDIKNISDCKSRLKQDGVVTSEVIDSLGRKQQATFIDESNLYKVIFQSRKPEAERFTEWVTSEVLPSIRKTGGYIVGEENMSEDELILKAMTVLNKKVENLKLENAQQKQIIGELKPKADYTDMILKNKGLVTVNAIAKDYGMTAISLNRILHNLGVQYKQGRQWFLYTRYQNCGYTHSETIQFYHKDGTSDVNMLTKWTQKGRLFLYELLKNNGIIPVIEMKG